jgi:hypothetical protein
MALEVRAAPRPVSARRSPRTAARAPWTMVAADRLLAAYWTRDPFEDSSRLNDPDWRIPLHTRAT